MEDPFEPAWVNMQEINRAALQTLEICKILKDLKSWTKFELHFLVTKKKTL